ncbi:MAG: hypothetical protein ABEJ93_04960 [Candidatus Nanohalobium sp.]
MTYNYLLAGENLELAEAELKGFLRSQDIREEPEREERLAETESEPGQLKRLALTHEITEKLETVSKPEKASYTPQKSFAVRAEEIEGEHNTKKIEEKLGNRLETKENSVNLENPEEEIKAYLFNDKIILGRKVEDINRGLFNKRSNEKRPFSSPVSLDPVLARVLVNLSEVSAGETVLDPFCGTGGILIESGLCGCGVAGLDVKKEMVEGTRENLEEYGIIAHNIREDEASKALELFEPSVLITDLPYGKASKEKGDPVEDFLELLEEFDGRTVFMWNEDELGGYQAEFSIYVHKNLTRHVFIV